MNRRQQRYWALHDFSRGRGLEIGPLHRTLVPREAADVRYADVRDRAGLLAHYTGDPDVDPTLVPEIDYVLLHEDGTARSLAEAAGEGAPFAWVVASHVIEHVPDVIGWLADLAAVVEDDGVLVLAVPDRRYCFDVLRPPTTIGQMIQAHLDADTRPSARAVHDHFHGAVSADLRRLWRGHAPGYDARRHDLVLAETMLAHSRDGAYVDCHVWLFTPESLVEQMYVLRRSGRSAWFVDAVVPTAPGDLEFQVRMRRLPRAMGDSTTAVTGETLPTASGPDWSPLGELTARGPSEEAQALRRRLQEQRSRTRELRRELTALRSSRRWRWSGRAVAPLRAARRLRRRLSRRG